MARFLDDFVALNFPYLNVSVVSHSFTFVGHSSGRTPLPSNVIFLLKGDIFYFIYFFISTTRT